MTDSVVIEGLSVRYGAVDALRDVSMTVPRGSITAVVGPSGCGKSTLLRAVAGLERASAGRIDVDGRAVTGPGVHVTPERRSVGLVPQDGALFSHLSVHGNVGFGLGPRWRRTPGRDARIAELLAAIDLSEYARRRPSELSGGQQQRVALARALAPRPAVIGLDEPFSALDAALRSRLRDHVRDTLRAEGATALLVTHDAEEALAMADAVVVLVDGAVRQSGTITEVYSEPVDVEVARLFGDVADVDADAEADSAACAWGRVPLRNTVSGEVSLLVRPSDLRVEPGGDARVVDVRFLGDRTCLTVDLGSTTIRCDTTEAFTVGDAVTIRANRPLHAVAR